MNHGGRMHDKEMACRTWPRITPQTKIFDYDQKHICLPHLAHKFQIRLSILLQNWFHSIMGRKWVFLVIMLLHAMNNIILSVFWPNHFTNAFATDRIFQDVAVASVAFSYFTFDKSTSADPFFALRCAGQTLPGWHGRFHSGTLSALKWSHSKQLFQARLWLSNLGGKSDRFIWSKFGQRSKV